MRSKTKLATGLSVAATMTFAALGTGSGAGAQDRAPTLVEPAIQFTASPVIQAIPQAEASATPDAAVADDADSDADNLPDLVAAQPQPEELSDQMHCLAGAIYFEAKGETLPGQLAVARVIVQRAGSGRFPASYCGVVYQTSQFSFVQGRRMPAIRKASAAWRQAVAIAQIADKGTWDSPTEGALYFHAARISPSWKLKRIARVDDHIFYR